MVKLTKDQLERKKDPFKWDFKRFKSERKTFSLKRLLKEKETRINRHNKYMAYMDILIRMKGGIK